ncbi:riboflavin synthase [Kordiimonas aestuarii]|uniref:riboflavin synthase n=1 Tax=Kordiimonas aestuarii TaxID=1005925 RepID=UPI0021D2B502|nr:riboflavin synthase [Kordiimonas aestuarii]
MFTGIVTDVGRVTATKGTSDVQATISTRYDMSRVDIGASIACAGVCLTVVDKGDGWFKADVSAETLKVTNLGDWREGCEINLERSLKLGDELGGHIVTGHVDCVGDIVRFDQFGESVVMEVAVPHAHGAHVAQKGSVTIDGASLTVNEVVDEGGVTRFSINLIPHTQSVTSFRNSRRGDRVNVEFDILARYVARLQDRG